MKKILEFIKKFFRLKNNHNETIENEIIKDEYKEIIESPVIKNINWKLINSLNNYDIVLVKMTDEEINRRNIKKDHQKRPFLIKYKNDKTEMLSGYYFTSNINNHRFFKKEKNKGLKIVLNKDTYKINKNTLLLFEEDIKLPYENAIHFMAHITNRDLSKLKKYKNLLSKVEVISNNENMVIEISDIISKDNNKYIIYQIDNTSCYGYSINESNDDIDLEKDHNYIMFNKQLYFIDYKNNIVLNKNEEIHIIGRFNDDVVNIIKENKKQLKFEQKEKCKKKR